METPSCCPTERHQHGGRKPTATSVSEFSCESLKSSLKKPINIKLTLSQIQGLFLHDSSLGHQEMSCYAKKLQAIETKGGPFQGEKFLTALGLHKSKNSGEAIISYF